MAYGKSLGFGNFAKGFRQFTGESLTNAFTKMLEGGISRQDGLTAKAGGTKAAAIQLARSLNRLAVCATAGDSALLPKAIAGSMVVVVNSGAASANLYGTGTDTINGSATATAYALAAGKSVIFTCLTTGAWFGNLSA